MRVVCTADPGYLVVESENGTRLKVGRGAAKLIPKITED